MLYLNRDAFNSRGHFFVQLLPTSIKSFFCVKVLFVFLMRKRKKKNSTCKDQRYNLHKLNKSNGTDTAIDNLWICIRLAACNVTHNEMLWVIISNSIKFVDGLRNLCVLLVEMKRIFCQIRIYQIQSKFID